MQTKIYFASSIPAAIETAREELGPEAMLVNSRPAPPEVRGFGRLEVTFAYEARGEADFGPSLMPVPRSGMGSPKSELDDIRSELSALRIAVGRAQGVDVENVREMTPIAERLCDAGFSADSAREFAAGIRSENDAVRILAAKIPVAPFVELQPGDTRSVAFVGPAGRGKTTTLVKLAMSAGIARNVPVRIYSAGTHGVGAQEQMARYAAILGVPHQAFESIDSLGLALTGNGSWKGLSLIDTPGLSPADHQDIRDFGRFFAARPEIETNLVVRAEGRSADHLATVERFSGFKLSRILFTGTDEMAGAGSMVETLLRANIPATFVGAGPGIPDGLEEIDAGRFVRGLFTRASTAKRLALAAA